MRILIYGINFAPELTGIGKYTGELAEYLVHKNFNLRVITAFPYYPQWKITDGYESRMYRKEEWNGIEIYRVPLWVPNQPTGLKRIIHLLSFTICSIPVVLKQISWSPDIVFSIIPTLFISPLALMLSALSGAKSWLHIQDFEVELAFKLRIIPENGKISSIISTIEKRIYTYFDKISTISQHMMDTLQKKGVSQEKTYFFPNWVDCEKIYPLPEYPSLRYELGYSDDQFVVLYSGNLGRKQGLELLPIVANLLRDDTQVKFLICGDGAARSELMEQSLHVPNLQLLPLQPEERLNELLNLADVHVLPQREESADLVMPSKLTGMLASGKPVIATGKGGSEVSRVISEVGYLVNPGNPEVLVNAIKDLAANKEKREHLGSLGRKYVQEHWEKEKVLIELIKEVKLLVKKDQKV